MPEYKLTYFNLRGLGEVIRQIFIYADVPFEDNRIEIGDLTPEKKIELDLEWGQLPILEIDGKKKAQSFAIGRYLSKKYNLLGDNEEQAFRCDEVVEAIRDYMLKAQPIFRAMFAKDADLVEKGKKTLTEEDTPTHFARFNKLLEKKGNTWLVGDRLSYADLVFVHTITNFETVLGLPLAKGYPAIEKLIAAVQAEPKIKAWLEKRPATTF